jgi:carbamoyltransferase
MMEEQTWKPFQRDLQTSFLGPKSSVPTEEKIRNVFSQYKLSVESEIHKKVASEIADGKIVAWFQGRSECGPRSLGHRSILARPDRTDLKNYLNSHIKFRENFRPYGCTCIWEKAHEIFNVPAGFENPFMSFAVPVNEKWKQKLQHVTHVDGTSRMQTLHESQEPLFYKLLLEVEKLTGLPLVLNTSLNIMGEPILETIEDAERFFKDSAVDGLCIGNVWITK